MSEQSPTPPQPLNYRGFDPGLTAELKKKRWKFIKEMLAGGGSWIAVCLLSALYAGLVHNAAPGAIMLGLGFVAMIIWGAENRATMRGFLPGFFICVALTCLVPVGVLWATQR